MKQKSVLRERILILSTKHINEFSVDSAILFSKSRCNILSRNRNSESLNYFEILIMIVWNLKIFLDTMDILTVFSSVQFSSLAQSCLTLYDPMNRKTPGLPVHHQLPEFTQTHVHQVSDAIQPSHPLSSPSPPAPNPSQHQSPFQ